MKINKNDITIISYANHSDYIGADERTGLCCDNIIQYRIGDDFTSFMFCESEPYDIEGIKKEIIEALDNLEHPHWTQLSDTLRTEIIHSGFDMYFIDLDDELWTNEKAEKIYDEVIELGLDDCIKMGEDEAYLSFYRASMCTINWHEHEVLGKTYFDKKIKSVEQVFEENGFNIDIDENLNQIDIYNNTNNNSICSVFFYTSEQYGNDFDEIDEIVSSIENVESQYMKNLVSKDDSIQIRLSDLVKELENKSNYIYWETEPVFINELKEEINLSELEI